MKFLELLRSILGYKTALENVFYSNSMRLKSSLLLNKMLLFVVYLEFLTLHSLLEGCFREIFWIVL